MRDATSLSFSVVPSSAAEEAFAFHHQIAASNEHIWPRTLEQLKGFAQEGFLFGARRTDTGEFVALCYVAREGDAGDREVGGLTVADSVQKHGVGTFLVRFALAHVMTYENPWATGQDVIAYVHESNDRPRGLLKRLGFTHVDRIEIDGADAPPSMKRNAAGNLVGDRFRFTRDGLRALAGWFTNEFDGTLGRGGPKAEIRLHEPARLEDMLEALRDLAQNL